MTCGKGTATARELWERYKRYATAYPELGFSLDISRMNFPDGYLEAMQPRMNEAFREMAELEAGRRVNTDENRMVGHYWLRHPEASPLPDITRDIREMITQVRDFSRDVHRGVIVTPGGARFTRLLIIGIGGSVLGTQFVSSALRRAQSPLRPYFFDNTDPDGFDSLFACLGERLAHTLTIVISKSGSTVETRNGMLEAREAYRKLGLAFERQAVAVTENDSELHRLAQQDGWLASFPLWAWVGGRTSVTSAVGLLPAALQGISIDDVLAGAKQCDETTRIEDVHRNPAALLALMWLYATNGRGDKEMVIIPYKDRLQLFSKYLQQLIMESLGKERDRAGNIVRQGIVVYGNKGSTDQHAYVQQLRDGLSNFFVTFIEVLTDRLGNSCQVGEDVTSGDYLHGFLEGTRRALHENHRESLTLTLGRIDARTIGSVIALYERAVGLYASLIGINAYHQPGVEAGKRAADRVIRLQRSVLAYLRDTPHRSCTAEEIALVIGAEDEVETVYKLLEHAAANPDHRITKTTATCPWDALYQYTAEL